MHCFWIAALLTFATPCHGQLIHPNAHAHNDYEHPRPLLDAWDNGFRSMEADIHLVGDDLYVAHNHPKVSEKRTLQKLYLDPLDSLVRLEAAKKSPGSITLLIDIKTDASRTLQKLIEVLSKYPRLFPADPSHPVVRIVISGNRDYALILKSNHVYIDGRPGDLGKGYSANQMPLISDHYRNWMRWNGKGAPDASELEKIRTLAQRVHDENKKLRLWAIPDNEVAWAVLLDAGVDLINTDRLEALSAYLNQRDRN
ncbi:MAG: phosphatidylinositol-specific phospholipase C/glycerophosphodiester phosphodiesterase family protein [Cyclobacteriaceae bacterium]|nr:phosphatidylinositol-specific phospholipase C/glycerophosphodiester phosphodiesterase family protein [Cyclobacteriaceae bacterium]